jgi:hypothetical protein
VTGQFSPEFAGLLVITRRHYDFQHGIQIARALFITGKRIKWLILPLHESETDRHLIGLSG